MHRSHNIPLYRLNERGKTRYKVIKSFETLTKHVPGSFIPSRSPHPNSSKFTWPLPSSEGCRPHSPRSMDGFREGVTWGKYETWGEIHGLGVPRSTQGGQGPNVTVHLDSSTFPATHQHQNALWHASPTYIIYTQNRANIGLLQYLHDDNSGPGVPAPTHHSPRMHPIRLPQFAMR